MIYITILKQKPSRKLTEYEINQIADLRNDGFSYNRIAKQMKISPNTIKSCCRKYNLTKDSLERKTFCLNCGVHIEDDEKFCSDECKNEWFSKHPKNSNLKCTYCGRPFKGNKKYCCQACYVADRFRATIA